MNDPDAKSWPVIGVVLTLTSSTTLLVVSRVYSCRFLLRRRLYFEEWLCLVALIFLLISASFAIKLCTVGGGQRWATLTDYERTNTRFWYFVWSLTSGTILALPDMAVANLMCRLFKPPTWQKILLWTIAIMCNVNFALTVIMKLARCKPSLPPWLWDGGIKERTQCDDYQPYLSYFLYAAAFSALTNATFAAYPAICLRHLNWDRSKKIAVSSALGLSIFATGIACYRCSIFHGVLSSDYSYDVVNLVIWTMIEGNVILIAACVPTLHPVYEKLASLLSGRRWQERGILPTQKRFRSSPATSWVQQRQQQENKKSFWSAIMPSFGSEEVPEADPPRTLEDAANLAYPPAVIWNPAVRVSAHRTNYVNP